MCIVNKRIRNWLLAVAILAIFLKVFVFQEKATVSAAAGYGTAPMLPEPNKTVVPTIRPARASTWSDGNIPNVAEGMKIEIFAENLDHPRWLYGLPNGDILVAETNAPVSVVESSGVMDRVRGFVQDRLMEYAGAATPSADRISLLRDANGDGIAEQSFAFIENLHSPFGISLIGESLYVANADALLRFPYDTGNTTITAAGHKLADLPADINHHWTKNLIAGRDGKKLFIAVGSNSNVGERGPDTESNRAAILEYDIATSTLAPYATGLRNPVGLAWEPESGELWTVVNERDEIGSDLVPDYITSIRKGQFFGWPYYYFRDQRDRRVDKYGWPDPPSIVAMPAYAVGAHTASLGIAFSNGSSLPESLRHGLFVSQHGSWNRRPRSGYKVIYIPFRNGEPEGLPVDVVTGFLGGWWQRAQGRPVGVVLDKLGALLVADDVGNVIWRVSTR